MPKTRRPYPAEFRSEMVRLVRAGRTPGELSREFEPSEVDTFLSDDGSPFVRPEKIIRSAAEERDRLGAEMDQLHHRNEKQAAELLDQLQRVALSGGNTFDALMAAAKVCSLGHMTHALYAVGGQYRRNM